MATLYYSFGKNGKRIYTPITTAKELRQVLAGMITEGGKKVKPIYFWSGPKTEKYNGIFYTQYTWGPFFYWLTKDTVYDYYYREDPAYTYMSKEPWHKARGIREQIKE